MAASAFLYNTDDDDDDSENNHHKKRLALSEDFFIFLTNEDNHHEEITMSDQSIQERSSDDENLKRQHNPRLVVRDEYFSILPNSETLKSEEKVVTNEQRGNSNIQRRQIKPPNKKREFSPRLAVNGEYFLFLPDSEAMVESEGEEKNNKQQFASKIQKRQTKPWWPPRKMDPESPTKAKRQTKPIWNFRSYISKKDMTSLDLNKRQRPPIRGPYAYHRIGIGKVHSNRHFVQKRNIDNGYEKRRLPEDIDIMYDNYIKRQKPPYTLGSLLLRESVDENTEQGKISGSPLSLRNFQKRQRPPGFMEHYNSSFAKRQKPPSSE